MQNYEIHITNKHEWEEFLFKNKGLVWPDGVPVYPDDYLEIPNEIYIEIDQEGVLKYITPEIKAAKNLLDNLIGEHDEKIK